MPLAVDLAHPPDVPCEAAFGHERRQGRLLDVRRVPVGQVAGLDQSGHQRQRRDEEPEPQRGRKHLRERPDVHHPAPGIQAVQRFQRSAGVAELAVVVVLDEHRVVPLGPVEQLERHRQAQRVLVRRRDVDQPRPRRDRADDDAFGVHRHRRDADAARAEHQPRWRVPGVLDGGQVTGPQQHPRHQVGRLLGAGGDDDLRRARPHVARHPGVPGDLRPQRRVALRVAVGHQAGLACPQPLRHQAAPGVEREQREIGDAGPEVELRCRGEGRGWRRDGVPFRERPHAGDRRRLGAARRGSRDERARADAPGEEALGGEPVVGRADRRPGDRQPLRELTGRRQRLAGPDAAVQDRRAELPVDRVAVAARPGQVDVDLHPRQSRLAHEG